MIGALIISICFGLLASIASLAIGLGLWAAVAAYAITGMVVFLVMLFRQRLLTGIKAVLPAATISSAEKR